MKKQFVLTCLILVWNAPVCWLAYKLASDDPIVGNVAQTLEFLESTERFLMNWAALNCLGALVGGVVVCVSPPLRRLIWGDDKHPEREFIVAFFGSLALALLGILLYRYVQ